MQIKCIMKGNYLISFIILFLFAISCNRFIPPYSTLNLSFENIENGMPAGWRTFHILNDYSVSLDSVEVISGKYSIAIEFKGNYPHFQAVQFVLPSKYDGKKITLSGYIKTENVADGYAGLWMRIDPENAYIDMKQDGITGTTNWKKYEISLNMDSGNSQLIVFGGKLEGKGKMWLDELTITIDGKNIEKVETIFFSEKAKNDYEFDTGSNIFFPELTEKKIDDLELLGRIWGFLKYHHPVIAKGNYNWDYELFRILPIYLKVSDNKQRDQILLQWINTYGKIPICNSCRATSENAFLKPNLSWIERSNINRQLKDLLHKIYLNRNQGNHYYIQTSPIVNNPLFENERAYDTMVYPDAGFRLLALFRYWNIIYYFYPYKYLTDKDWNDILKEYIPYFIKTENRLEYELIFAQIMGELCDTHAQLIAGRNKIEIFRGEKQVPVRIQFIENKWVVTDYYMDTILSDSEKEERTGLKIGDIITHIDGQSVESIVNGIKKYYPASNEVVRRRDIACDLLRSNNQEIHINYISSNQLKEKTINLESRGKVLYYQYKNDTTKCYKFLDEDIGYITLKSIKQEDIPVIKQEFLNTKGIIIDIRAYPSTRVVYNLGSYFVSKDTVFVRHTEVNPDNPGEFNLYSKYVILKSEEHYQGKLVVIVNEETQSLAEFTAMAFQTGNNTTIIGSQTAGVDGNVSEISLPGGLKTWISGNGTYYPDGRETQRIGIIPDIEIRPTIQGICEERDELLEKAIEIIRSDK